MPQLFFTYSLCDHPDDLLGQVNDDEMTKSRVVLDWIKMVLMLLLLLHSISLLMSLFGGLYILYPFKNRNLGMLVHYDNSHQST